MEEMSLEYWNELAKQIIMISSLLGGFSIAVIANFLVSDTNNVLSKRIMIAAVLAASFFLISLFAMTKIIMMTTNGFPSKVSDGELMITSTIGGMTFLFGIISLIAMISLAGWTKSKKMGRLTTVIGIFTLILILFFIT